MNWRRVHPKGEDPEHHKEWRSGKYHIIWRDRVFEVTVDQGYHILTKLEDGSWDLLNRYKRLKRTLKAAKRACELHANPPKKRKKRKRK